MIPSLRRIWRLLHPSPDEVRQFIADEGLGVETETRLGRALALEYYHARVQALVDDCIPEAGSLEERRPWLAGTDYQWPSASAIEEWERRTA